MFYCEFNWNFKIIYINKLNIINRLPELFNHNLARSGSVGNLNKCNELLVLLLLPQLKKTHLFPLCILKNLNNIIYNVQ